MGNKRLTKEQKLKAEAELRSICGDSFEHSLFPKNFLIKSYCTFTFKDFNEQTLIVIRDNGKRTTTIKASVKLKDIKEILRK